MRFRFDSFKSELSSFAPAFTEVYGFGLFGINENSPLFITSCVTYLKLFVDLFRF